MPEFFLPLPINDATATRTSRRAIGLISKTTTLLIHHAFFVHLVAVLHDYGVKMRNLTFYGGRKQPSTEF